MKTPPSKERAESRVVNRYHKLYKPLVELVDALQDLEPGGTLVDNIRIGKSEVDKQVHIEYTAHPVTLTIKDSDQAFVLRIAGHP
ncbi:MAG TPA: hypothetical protein VJR27_03235 [Candidatus Saccharimonadales bacterium]|nr:hypothetical protein [Candidatus Saccharimonadales bacterium]